jgi:hypothetical protein
MITYHGFRRAPIIPSEIRREAAFEPGAPLEVRWQDGVIESSRSRSL